MTDDTRARPARPAEDPPDRTAGPYEAYAAALVVAAAAVAVRRRRPRSTAAG